MMKTMNHITQLLLQRQAYVYNIYESMRAWPGPRARSQRWQRLRPQQAAAQHREPASPATAARSGMLTTLLLAAAAAPAVVGAFGSAPTQHPSCGQATAGPSGAYPSFPGCLRKPPMGWMSWEIFRCDVKCDEDPKSCINHVLYEQMTDHIVEDGYLALGYDQVSIDDCWERRGPGGPHGNETWRKDPDSGRVNGSLAPNSTRFPVRVARFTNKMNAASPCNALQRLQCVSGKETQRDHQ